LNRLWSVVLLVPWNYVQWVDTPKGHCVWVGGVCRCGLAAPFAFTACFSSFSLAGPSRSFFPLPPRCCLPPTCPFPPPTPKPCLERCRVFSLRPSPLFFVEQTQQSSASDSWFRRPWTSPSDYARAYSPTDVLDHWVFFFFIPNFITCCCPSPASAVGAFVFIPRWSCIMTSHTIFWPASLSHVPNQIVPPF